MISDVELKKWVREDKIVQEWDEGEAISVEELLDRIITLTRVKVENELYKEHKKDVMMLISKIDCWEQRFFNKHEKELDKVVKGIDQGIRY